jgi:spore germination cell wall hydrolase CwlJ-like protein
MDDAAYEALMARLNEAYPSQPAYTPADVKLQSGQITRQQGQDPVMLMNPRTLQQGESNPIDFDQSGGIGQLGAMINAGRLRGMLDMSAQDGMTPGYNAMGTMQLPEGYSASYRRSNEIGGLGDAQNAIMLAKQFGEPNTPSPSLSAGASRSGMAGPITYDLSGSVPLTTGRNPEAPQFRLPSSREEQPMVPPSRRDRERQPSRQEVKGAATAGLSHSPRDHSTRANAGLKFNFADGGHVDAALHLLRQHFDEGGFLSSLSNLFSGPDYLSTGDVASPTNWGDPELASDFFKADRALRLAREVQASEPARDMPLPLRRPAPEAAPRQQVAAPPPAPAPATRRIETLPGDTVEPHEFPPALERTIGPYDFGQAVSGQQVTTQMLPHFRESPGFGQVLLNNKTNWADAQPEVPTSSPQRYTMPEAALVPPASEAEINNVVTLAQNLAPQQEPLAFDQALVPQIAAAYGPIGSFDQALIPQVASAYGPIPANRPDAQAETDRAVSLARETIPSAADALAAVEKLHNAGVYSGEALDKAGEILAAHNRAMFDNIPVEEALRLIRAEGPRMVNQGMPVTGGATRDIVPLSYAETPTPAPASAAIDQATGKLTARIPEEPFAVPLTAKQGDYIARTVATESSGDPAESRAIADVILNRIRSGRFGSSPEAVLFAKNQFEPWMNPAGKNYPLKVSPKSQKYLSSQEALEEALTGGDTTGGAFNFWGPGSQFALGRSTPKFARDMPDYVDIGATRFHRPNKRAHGGLVDDALHVVREHHADGEAVGQAPEMPAEEPRPLTIYRGNAPVADEAGGSGREPAPVPAFSYMPMPESVERQAARQPAYNPAERTWSDAGSTEGERLTRALGVEGELPKGETFMSAQPSGWDKYKPQRRPGTFLKRWGEAFNENADAVEEGLKAVREGNYGAGALGMVGGALGAAISPLTGMERVLVRDPYLRMTGNLKDAQAAEMVADTALTGGVRGMVTPFAKAGSLERMATEPWNKARLPSPAATGAATAAGAMLTPEDAEASKLSKAMEVARMAIPRELSPLGFYSHGAEAARGLAQAKGTPQQYAAMLQKSGVKGPEIEGFLNTFGGRPIVTQDEAAQYFKGAMPQIEETVLGVNAARQSKLDAINNELGSLADSEIAAGRVPAENPRFKELEKQYYEIADNSVAETPTKFSQYTLPGGENYREVLLKMAPEMRHVSLDEVNAQRQKISSMLPSLTQSEYDAMLASGDIAKIEANPNAGKFKSSHWDDPNVLAHLRMSDRTGPNGEKILHVEEIQSDWGQKGKKEGFDVGITPQQEKRMQNLTARVANLSTAEREELGDLLRASGKGVVPSAPYVTSTQGWTDLALKRALREAAEGGYDKLVWTPGAEQAKRYSLSNQVRSIDYMKEGDNSYRLGIVDKRGEGIDLPKETFTAKELEDYLGQDVASKIINDEGQSYRGRNHKSLEGVDLVLGGEGMKGYYDKIVPNQLSKLVKKLDPEAKVGRETLETRAMTPEQLMNERTIPDQNQVDFHSLTITPKMREAIMKGQTAFKDGGSVEDRALMLVSRQA